jgi:hypothetical protein
MSLKPVRLRLQPLQHLYRSPFTHQLRLQQLRSYAAKSSDPNKPIILEQPDSFRPPSHPSRLRRRRKGYYGRDLTEEDKQEMDSKQYPFMFPPEGTTMHWLLTTKWIHAALALVSLSNWD